MSDPFLDDEKSVSGSRPREFYDIVQDDSTTYRIASGVRDVVYNGNTYIATPSARTDVGILTSSATLALTLALPLTHALSQRWLAQSSPPRQVNVTVYRQQLNSGLVETIWIGQIVAMSIDSHLGRFQIQSRMSRTLDRNVCSFVAQQLCPHTLYDGMCLIDPAGFSITTTVARFDGRTLTVDGSDSRFSDPTFAVGGDVSHPATGERQLIINESVINISDLTVDLTMLAPIPNIKVGDTVVVRAGCSHTTSTCLVKFDNMVHYGGLPGMPTLDLWLPGNGLGVFQT